MNEKIKIHDSQGKIYKICPFLEKIDEIAGRSFYEEKVLKIEEIFEIRQHLEAIREIAKFYQKEEEYIEINVQNIHQPYNFIAAIRNLKLVIRQGNLDEKKIDEILKIYL